jgi:rhodanese-related sulfurtransferase
VWIPEREIACRVDALPKHRLIILYCWDTWCGLVTAAAVLLIDRGYRVKELHGGSRGWKTLQLPEFDVRECDVAAAA